MHEPHADADVPHRPHDACVADMHGSGAADSREGAVDGGRPPLSLREGVHSEGMLRQRRVPWQQRRLPPNVVRVRTARVHVDGQGQDKLLRTGVRTCGRQQRYPVEVRVVADDGVAGSVPVGPLPL